MTQFEAVRNIVKASRKRELEQQVRKLEEELEQLKKELKGQKGN